MVRIIAWAETATTLLEVLIAAVTSEMFLWVTPAQVIRSYNNYKTGIVNDPLGMIHTQPAVKICFVLLDFEMW